MVNDLRIKVSALEYHRNGVCGTGFTVARFSFKGDGRKRIQAIATIFDVEDEICTGVIALDDAGKPDIGQCWRGDHFHEALTSFVKSDEGHSMMFPLLYPTPEAYRNRHSNIAA